MAVTLRGLIAAELTLEVMTVDPMQTARPQDRFVEAAGRIFPL